LGTRRPNPIGPKLSSPSQPLQGCSGRLRAESADASERPRKSVDVYGG
jgi:hypothetical protein